MKPGSQNARLLAVLRVGPATNREIHERAGHMIVNSRVSELRDKEYVIECERLGGTGADAYLYTLLSEPEDAPARLVTGLGSAVAAADVPGSESSLTIGAGPQAGGTDGNQAFAAPAPNPSPGRDPVTPCCPAGATQLSLEGLAA